MDKKTSKAAAVAEAETAQPPAGEGTAAQGDHQDGASLLERMINENARRPKENYVRDKMKLDDLTPEAEEGEDPEEDQPADPQGDPYTRQAGPQAPPMSENEYQKQARFWVNLIDMATSYGLTMYAGGPGWETYKADEKSLDQMADALAEGMQEAGIDFRIPWWAQFVFVALLAYWPKWKLARDFRRQHMAEAAHAREAYSPAAQAAQARAQQAAAAPPAANEQVLHETPPGSGNFEPAMNRYCALPGCNKLLKPTQKHYCSKEHRMHALNGKAGKPQPPHPGTGTHDTPVETPLA